jgi:hypothetical protein
VIKHTDLHQCIDYKIYKGQIYPKSKRREVFLADNGLVALLALGFATLQWFLFIVAGSSTFFTG